MISVPGKKSSMQVLLSARILMFLAALNIDYFDIEANVLALNCTIQKNFLINGKALDKC